MIASFPEVRHSAGSEDPKPFTADLPKGGEVPERGCYNYLGVSERERFRTEVAINHSPIFTKLHAETGLSQQVENDLLYQKDSLTRSFHEELDPYEKPGGMTGKHLTLGQSSDPQHHGDTARPQYVMGRKMSSLNFTDVHSAARISSGSANYSRPRGPFRFRSSSKYQPSKVAIGNRGKLLYNHQTLDSKKSLADQVSLRLDNFGSGHMDHRVDESVIFDFFKSIDAAQHICELHIVRRNKLASRNEPNKRDKLAYVSLPSQSVARQIIKAHKVHIGRQDGRFFRVKVSEVSQYQKDNSHYFSFDHRVGNSQKAINLEAINKS